MAIKLFCLPYAGGSAAVFNKCREFTGSNISLHPVEMSGRGTLMAQPPYATVEAAVADVLMRIREELHNGPYALLGYSMGAVLAYELALKIKEQHLPAPVHLFFLGKGAPDVQLPVERTYHWLDDHSFKKMLLEMGGTPPEFFQYPELQEFFIPLLRNDFRLAETDFSLRKVTTHACDISVLLGKDEKVSVESADAWKYHTTGACHVSYFEGGHFFLNNNVEKVMTLINRTLT
ncbi:Surfactin synthase thioesterase subunit [Chitinophaga costaii]|uniref:Surfactin synthase thioesterase subunit n=1 Tax=Chitinophaga costaii TaxID=1335309 RepID=A0A1C3YT99_9BACT|nr:thioesterase domain-containing protein [Chitinophaga costaii]SCB73280.1 Surfactin synthase thioesterase subunit [Chitinophaga costaii]